MWLSGGTQVGSRDRGPGLGLAILAVGIAIGWLLAPRASEGGPGREPTPASAPGPGTPAPGVGAPNELTSLAFRFDDDQLERLLEDRARALSSGRIVTDRLRVVDGTLEVDGHEVPIRARLKGDWTDHVDTPKWSLRVETVGDKVLGMARFSVQHPKTRGYLWGWLALQAARDEGLLAPRASFVNVTINGEARGVFQLEEHFSKELLESQGRREAPIVRFDESSFWALTDLEVSPELPGGESGLRTMAAAFAAETDAFGARKLEGDATLNRQLASALRKLRELQLQQMLLADELDPLDGVIDTEAESPTRLLQRRLHGLASQEPNLAARWQASQDLAVREIGELLDLPAFARMLALLSITDGAHGAVWHNLRFYHDPVRDRLEPIVFDVTGTPLPRAGADPLIWSRDVVLALVLRQDPAFVVASFQELARMSDPGWLGELIERHRDELGRYEAALVAEGTLPVGQRLASVEGRLATRAQELRRRLSPGAALHTVASLEVADGAPQADGTLVVDVWATTRAPVFLDAFRFSNGHALAALDVLERRPGDGAAEVDGRLLLPTDGRRLRFRFAANERLATLRELRQVVDAVELGGETDQRVEQTIELEHSFAAGGPARATRLAIRRVDPAWELTGGRPTPPTIEACLARHPFLSYDALHRRMVVTPGRHDVAGDLVLPAGVGLQAGAGTALRFGASAVLVSDSALVLEGRAEAPVELVPREEDAGWAGLMVIDADEQSLLVHTVIRGTREVHRAGWSSTGGTTFYRSPLEARFALWEDARGEDALNVFGAAFLLDRSRFLRTASDAFDGDFVTGTLRTCEFEGVAADAIDVSGSEVQVLQCRFGKVLDKAISAGEVSRVAVEGCLVQEAMIGIAAKDGSRVDARDVRITRATRYALAAYIKKPEYQASTIVIEDLQVGQADMGPTIVQTGCVIELDGAPQPTMDLDVPDLYERGILGR